MHSCCIVNSITVCIMVFSRIRKYKLLIINPNARTDTAVIFALPKQSPESTGCMQVSSERKEYCLLIPEDKSVTKMKRGFLQYDTQGDNLHT